MRAEQAVSGTAGFNAIDYGKASDSTNFLTIMLMSIGGAPGSTAGGMKVTAFMTDKFMATPGPGYRLKESDTIFVAGDDETLKKVASIE